MAASLAVTTVILIRHAERGNPADPDPHLNAAGRARATELTRVLGQSGTTAIYTSQFVRTKETAQPLGTLLGLTPKVIDEADALEDDILTNHRGKTVLVIGHSDTVPALINLLAGTSLPELDSSEFDNLFVVSAFASGRAGVTHLKYGAPS